MSGGNNCPSVFQHWSLISRLTDSTSACLFRQLKFNLPSKYTAPQIYPFILHVNEYDLSKTSDPRLHYLTPSSNWSSFLFFPMPLHLVFLSHIYMQTNYNLSSPYMSQQLATVCNHFPNFKSTSRAFQKIPCSYNWINGDLKLKHCSLATSEVSECKI